MRLPIFAGTGSAAPTPPPFDPSSIAGLVGWWKADALSLADGDPVATWTASAGPDLTATGTARPTFKTGILNSRPVVRFNGSSNVMAAATSVTGPQTVFAVAKYSNSLFFDYDGLFTHNAANDPSGVVFTGQISSTNWFPGFWASPAYRTGGTADATYQGPLNAFAYFDVETTNVLSAFVPQIGRDRGNARFWVGDVCEIIAYSPLVDGSDVTAVESYLKTKWGL